MGHPHSEGISLSYEVDNHPFQQLSGPAGRPRPRRTALRRLVIYTHGSVSPRQHLRNLFRPEPQGGEDLIAMFA